MKFICLGYLDAEKWNLKPESERNAMIDQCFAYDNTLRAAGAWLGGEALEAPGRAATLRHRKGDVSVTDGPFIETKEILGGLMIMEARDRAHAIELLSKHPGVQMGPWEIRPVADISGMIRESEERRRAAKS